MSDLVHVAIHASQFPGSVRNDLLASLRSKVINHKFHYDGIKQTLKWLQLHERYSPARINPDCLSIYSNLFRAACLRTKPARTHLISLGCGGGQKDCQFIQMLGENGKTVFYTPSDVSTSMVLVAQAASARLISPEKCFPVVCDLQTSHDLTQILLEQQISNAGRVVAFFGMLPNFEPIQILSKLAALVRIDDLLLVSANLAPGIDYKAGVIQVLPQYDNELTREWLTIFLSDLGVEIADGELQFRIETDPGPLALKRITAYYRFARKWKIRIDSEDFIFNPGEELKLFFSYRYTPELLSRLFQEPGLRVIEQWLTPEEGVFLISR